MGQQISQHDKAAAPKSEKMILILETSKTEKKTVS